ncbi:uncharacterized protein LOC118740675 isoform X2 [Rhagoletis pomonella]|uniref:uncharacterized protein LOC118740675 isoform X1 n=1 Tax=Rhagoletis pomonella TaxID=28610 RepID=UPI00178378C2|nr:uncharacterized protein LOC118740675 isoform X1 [Rhagoletis pomonella]XP_036328189.1 uncharacterized protein LOC118740675 isoform X2 [Rhagoletis pomonella]
MSWVPTTDFEEEIVDLQPDHNFIFGQLCDNKPQAFYPRPKAHLDFIAQQKNEKTKREKNFTNSQNHKLNLIAQVQRIAGTKPLGEQPTIDDWNDNEHLERETIAMMRHVGLGPKLEQPLDEARTIATYPITDKVRINRNGRKEMPIFFDEKFFTLKPRISSSPPSSGNNSPIFEGQISPDQSSVSYASSSAATSSDHFVGQSSASPNSGFESAIDSVGDEDTFKTAQSSGNESSTRNWRRNKSRNDTKTWRSVDSTIKSQSWRQSNTKSQNRNGVSNEIQNNNCNWRATKSMDRKVGTLPTRKKESQLCTPKELYEKKRTMN